MDTVKIDVPKCVTAILEFTPKPILAFDILVIIGGFAGMIGAIFTETPSPHMFVAQAGAVCQVGIRYAILYNMGINYKWERVSCLTKCMVSSCNHLNDSKQCLQAKTCDGWKES